MQQHSFDVDSVLDEPNTGSALPEDLGTFGEEFRELARQRRFVRDPAPAAPPARSDAVRPSTAASPSLPPAARKTDADTAAVAVELNRMATQVIDAKEQLGAVRARMQRSEADLGAMNERLMAARALVHDAQRSSRLAADRCAFLEGRAEALQESLDIAVNASYMQRWRWRRQQIRDRFSRG